MREETANTDRVIFVLVIILMAIGAILVFSATVYISNLKYNNALYFLLKHFVIVLLGFFSMLAFYLIDYRKLRDLAVPIFALTVFLLVLVLFIGKGSARRWLNLGFFNVQVSEVAKVSLLIFLSYLLEKKMKEVKNFAKGFLPGLAVVSLVSFLVAIEPSFSMAFLIFIVGVGMIFIAGARISHIAGMLFAFVPVLTIFVLIEPYRFKRILAFLGVGSVPEKVVFQAKQALIGLGNGGLFGIGPGHSRQRELFLPLAYNDYIFSILGEEYGFIGALILIFVLFILLFRGFRIAKFAHDYFGKFLASGITLMLVMTSLFHIGVVSGLLPPTGIPLPFVSYGGSAMIMNSVAVGMLLNISKQSKISGR